MGWEQGHRYLSRDQRPGLKVGLIPPGCSFVLEHLVRPPTSHAPLLQVPVKALAGGELVNLMPASDWWQKQVFESVFAGRVAQWPNGPRLTKDSDSKEWVQILAGAGCRLILYIFYICSGGSNAWFVR